MDTKTIGVIGSGTMGSGIVQLAAVAGCNVLMFDANKVALTSAYDKIKKTLDGLVQKGKISADNASTAFSRIKLADSLENFNSCNLVIEAIIEDLAIKKELFKNLDEICQPSCILATNTSSISVTSIASACKNTSRVIGIHFFNPAPIMPLVEIIPGLATNPEITSQTVALIKSWGKTTVLAKDTPGFIVNRVARPFYGEAIRIYEEGIADFATIDWAVKEFGGFKMGPFELMDFIGNDVNYKVTETVWQQFFYDSRYRPSLTQKRLFEAGYWGKKTGKGYYDYSEGAKNPEAVKDPNLGKQILPRILAMLINEAYDALYYKIATKEDLETAMTKGVNYPKGLIQWSEEIGTVTIISVLEELYSTYKEERYRPSLLLIRSMAKNKINR
jgi:3-hydroxybutyryl-CoA dehydrogenase